MSHFPPYEHPAGWRGTELFSQPDWQVNLTPSELTELAAALQKSADIPPHELNSRSFELPHLAGKLSRIQDSLETGCGAVFVRGLAVAGYSESEAQRFFLGMMSHVGTPISQSAAGERIFSVRDAGFGATDSRTRGPNTSQKLSFHTDRCDVISFLTLKQARSGGENQLVSSIALYNEIGKRRPDLLEVLQQPFSYQRHNVDTGNENPLTQQPIFSIYQGHFACNFLRVLIERAYASAEVPEMSPQQTEALDFLEAVAAEPEMHVTFRQEPGDILLVNNWVLLHRRNAFTDHDDPNERRHLLRIWLSVPNSRPLHPDFAGNYGSTQAGAIRGGMKAKT